MTIGIHQPNYLPWLGYFEKMRWCDTFVILDNVQFEKNGFTNRTKIKTPRGEQWLTLSVKRNFPQLIKDVELANFQKDTERHLKAIELNYKKAKGFETAFPIIQKMFKTEWLSLSGFNIYLIGLLVKGLLVQPKIEIASQYNFEGKSTDLLINICKHFKADTYLSGDGGKKYQDEDKFKKAGIKLEYLNYVPKEYPQLWGNFIPNLSIIDYLLNADYSKE